MRARDAGVTALMADQTVGATVRVVVETILARIRSEDYGTDERLPSERALAVELGVARNTVREALDVLETSGVIRRRAGSGSFVTGLGELEEPAPGEAASETGPLDLQVMRGILEPEMVRLAIVNMSPRRIEDLGRTLSEMENVQTDANRFARLEDEFHRQLAEGTGNPLLIACYALILETRRQSFRAALNRRHLTPNRIQDFQRRYNQLFNAIAARDIETAAEYMKLQLTEEQKILLHQD
ncbi:MAG: FadR family transcriptional regulator [Proteobacteria bacterium]|nr:FadR family transcriptional regulator [Pseudomonadota bacterium]MBS0572256.1 FadR family transcriptional regulator [Pseudomonadota bacterium]